MTNLFLKYLHRFAKSELHQNPPKKQGRIESCEDDLITSAISNATQLMIGKEPEVLRVNWKEHPGKTVQSEDEYHNRIHISANEKPTKSSTKKSSAIFAFDRVRRADEKC